MEIAKCIRCGNLYSRVKMLVCPTCEVEEEKEIFRVQQFMRDHPGKTLEEVSDELNIYLEDIDRWIEENRLHVEVKEVSEKKKAIQELYETVRSDADRQTAENRERVKSLKTSNEEWGAGSGKYRRL